ncbi:MAG: hypothetical protein NZM00_04910, partial [Anaerolinea sp.]|nr:hypothetical protein [Anaerolinea sp.]
MTSIETPFSHNLQTGIADRARLSLRTVYRGLTGKPLPLLGTLIVVFFIVLAALGPLIAPYRFDEIIRGAARQPPSPAHLFGTDHLGRDVFS